MKSKIAKSGRPNTTTKITMIMVHVHQIKRNPMAILFKLLILVIIKAEILTHLPHKNSVSNGTIQ